MEVALQSEISVAERQTLACNHYGIDHNEGDNRFQAERSHFIEWI